MSILIENHETLEYLTEAGLWTKDPLHGKNFAASTGAYEAAKNERISKFNIVHHFPGTNQFVNLDHGRGKGVPNVSEESA